MSANFYDETGLAGSGVQKRFSELYRAVIARLGVEDVFEVDVTLTDEETIRTLNAENRGVDSVTDVLSFPVMDGVLPFDETAHEDDRDPEAGLCMRGAIGICHRRAEEQSAKGEPVQPPRARAADAHAEEQAEEYGHSLERELCYLFVHGLCHLFGFDHETDDQKAEMRAVEEAALTECGVTREV